MPAHLIAAAMAPKAGAMAAAAAAAVGAEDVVYDDVATHAVAATSFLHLPLPRSRILSFLLGPEIKIYNWLHDRFDGLFHKDLVSPDQARMVEYYAASCPHCQHLTPVWKQATSQWAGDAEANKVVWQQKECLDDNWKPGRDYKECQDQQIYGFPTIKFFRPGAKTGDDFIFERTPDKLVTFAKTGISPDPSHVPRGDGDMSDMKLVDYFSAACPHCKHLDPVWSDAEKKWEADYADREDAPIVTFEKKECYDDHWQPGKDFAECKSLGLKGFPTIKLFTPSDDGHGFMQQPNYEGERTSQGIIDFLKKQADLEEPTPADQGAQQHGDADLVKAAGTVDTNTGASAPHDEHAAPQVASTASADAGANPPSDQHVVQQAPEEEPRNEPTLDIAPTLGKATIAKEVKEAAAVVAAADEHEVLPAADVKDAPEGEIAADVPAALSQAVKTALTPLPLVSLSCLPARRFQRPVPHRSQRTMPLEAPPAIPAQFL